MAVLSEEPGPCSTIGGGGVLEGSSPGVTVETTVHAGVVSRREEGGSWSSVEVPAWGAMVALISWTPLTERETRAWRGGGGGGQVDDQPSRRCRQKVEALSLLRSERLPIGSPECDTPDEIVRTGFGEELVAGVQRLLAEGTGRMFGEVALVNDVIAMTFPAFLVKVRC